MGLKLEKMLLLISLVITLLVTQSSASSCTIQNELLETLTARLNLLETKNAEQEEQIIELEAKIAAKLESNQHDQSSRDERDIIRSITEYNKMRSIGKREGSSEDSPARAVLPSSCVDLSLIGHNLNGLYLVQNPDTNKIETVYCDFETPALDEVVGAVDVKTKNVHFFVQRNTPFSTPDSIIPFELERLNEGNAFNSFSGIFTAPVAGIYHFQFSGVKDEFVYSLGIKLQVNGVDVAYAYNYDASYSDNLSLSASLRLAANDKVNLYNSGAGVLSDLTGEHRTHFTGWLVDEDL